MHCLRSLFFLWLNPLLATGFRKPLQQHHVPALPEGARDTAKVSYARRSESLSRGHRHHDCSSAAALFWCIVKCHWVDLCGTGALALLKAIITSCNPLFVRYLMVFASKREVSHGYILVAALILTKVIECLAQRHWFFRARRMGLQLRSALVAAIYNKALKLSHRSRQRHSSGEIVSYISIDAYRLGEFMWWFHQLWTLFLRILIALGILLKLVRLATLSGLLIIVATTVIQAPLAKIQQRNQSKLSTAQDHRLRISSSVFSSMKIIKLQAWEGYFQQLIESFRAREYKWLCGVKEIGSVGSVIYYMSPIVTACVVLATCIPLSIKLDAVLVFTVLSTFRVIQQPLKVLPQALTAAIQAQVSLQRLSKFFNDEELQGISNAVVSDRNCGLYDAISIEAATFGWEQSGAFALVDLSLKVRNGELVAVCGAVGSGKSTLLQSILGEVPRLSGSSRVCGSLAYVSQTAWIRSGTVRENILFGKVMDTALYERVIKACALGEDIASFSHGDLTEIGERGLNLSGGQKQRLQLARALYADADIYLLDDPFSAVDAHTAAILFQECLLNELKNKTVILVTHQVEFLSSAGKILVMDSGSILHSGCYQELLSSVEVFDRLVNAHEDVSSVYQKHRKNEHNQRRCRDQYSDDRNAFSNSSVKKGSYEQLTREETAEGSVGLKPYLDYICVSSGKTLTGLGIILQGFLTGAALWSNYWLAREVANPRRSVRSLIGVFAAVSCATSVFVYARARVFVSLGLRASRAFFSGLNTSLFGAPMAFFDSTPIGRILGRASADISLLDVEVQTYLSVFLVGCFELAGILVVTTLVTWQIIFVAVPTLALIWLAQAYCSKSSRALVRINGITKAPVLNLTAETVNGAVTVRAFRKQAMFVTQNMELVDADAAISLHTYAAHEWFLMRAELLGTIILSAAALLIMIYRHHVRPGFAGFAYAFSLNANIFFTSNALNYLESYIISVERISHYMRLPAEAPSIIPTNRPPISWPMHGDIELQDLQVRYRPDSQLVIKGISCKFPGGKRVGLVGRTGSGKTTLISALFRLVEPAGGRIIIDGIDITTIGLLDLRTRIGVIPQEAFLFRGTVRSNLDPFHQFTDEQIWQSLRKCQLDGALKETSMQLDSIVSDDGENWSVGQRQLFCLARVLLKRSKVLVLDEATASVDSTTDAVLQRVIRDEFIGSTVITVAHRIPTVIDSDLVLGLKDGYKVEYDSPQALLDDKDSLFAKLVAEYYSTS